MKTQTETRQAKKISVDVLKLAEGDKIQGIFKGKTTGPWLDKQTGEEKELTRLHFVKPDGSRVVIFEDAGLRNAMSNAMVQEGQEIIVEKLAKQKLANGHTVNSYDIYGFDA